MIPTSGRGTGEIARISGFLAPHHYGLPALTPYVLNPALYVHNLKKYSTNLRIPTHSNLDTKFQTLNEPPYLLNISGNPKPSNCQLSINRDKITLDPPNPNPNIRLSPKSLYEPIVIIKS